MARSARRRTLLVLGAIACALVLFLVEEHVRGRVMLARYKHQLQSRGEKLTPESVGLLTNHAAESRELVALVAAMDEVAALKLSPPFIKAGKEAVAPGRLYALVNQKRLSDRSCGMVTWEQFSNGLKPTHPMLEKMKAHLQSASDIRENGSWNAWPDFQPKFRLPQQRQCAQWLAVAVIDDLHQGNLEKVVGNIEGIAAASLFRGNSYPVAACNAEISLQGYGLSTTWEALQAPGWNDAQLARLQKTWEATDLLNDFVHALEAERVREDVSMDAFSAPMEVSNMILDEHEWKSPPERDDYAVVFRAVYVDLVSRAQFRMWRLGWDDQEKLENFKRCQDSIDDARLIASRQWQRQQEKPDVPFVRKTWSQFRHFYTSSSDYQANCVYAVSAGNYVHAPTRDLKQKVVGIEIQRVLTVAAIALKRYRLRNGKYPASLDALVPDCISSVPLDPIDGKPLRYRLKPDGTFTLYSVGLDGQDDDGDPSPSVDKTTGASGPARDQVWPEPADPMEVFEELMPGSTTEKRKVMGFEYADLRRSLQFLAAQAGISLSIPSDLDGMVHGCLPGLSPEKAIRVILARKGFALEKAGAGYRIRRVDGAPASPAKTQEPLSDNTPPVLIVLWNMIGTEKNADGKTNVLKFVKTDLRLVIQAIAKHEKITMVLRNDVKGTVMARFVDVPFRTAMNSIIEAGGYGWFETNGCYIVHRKDWVVPESLKQDFASIPHAPEVLAAGAKSKKQILSFENADLRLVICAMAKQAGMSLIIRPEVTGTVTARLVDVPLGTAMRIITQNSGYGLYESNGFWVIHEKGWTVPESMKRDIASIVSQPKVAGSKVQVLSFEKPDIRLVLDAIAHQAKVSLIVPDDVKGTVTGRFVGGDILTIMKLITQACDYELFESHGFYLVHRKSWSVSDALKFEIMAADGAAAGRKDMAYENMEFGLMLRTLAGQNVGKVKIPDGVTGSLSARFVHMTPEKAMKILMALRNYFILEPEGTYRFADFTVE